MSDETHDAPEVREGSRIAKVMARAGLCSRREAETWVAAGRVTVNGKVLESPAYNVSDEDDVRVDGKRLTAPERTRLFLFHKPKGLVTTARDPEGRATIFDALPPDLPRLVAIGRLDINTEGLLLLTNDGGLARVLELPSTGWLRRYRVRAHGHVEQSQLEALSDGVTVDGIAYAGIEARLDREQGSNAWITMGLREGKNREIKKVLEHLGLAVNRLIRVSFGPFELGDLAEGEVAEVRTRVLRDQLGLKLAKEAGADFDSPIAAPAPPVEEPREARPRRPAAAAPRSARFDRDRDRDEAPRRAPPAPSTPERKRKHVSALRAEIAKDADNAAGPRKRIARGATQDRKGRTIAVERISKAGADADIYVEGTRKPRSGRPPARSPGGGETGREFSGRPRRPASSEAGRSRDGAGRERSRGEGGGRAEFKPRGPRKDGDARPPHGERREGGPRAEFKPRGPRKDGDARPPHGERREGGPRAEFKPRGPRKDGDARAPYGERREGGPRAEFKPRGPRKAWDAGAPRARRPERPDGERTPRSPKAEGDARRDGATRSEGPRSRSGGAGFGRPGGKPRGAPGAGRKPGGGPPKGAGGRGRPPGKR